MICRKCRDAADRQAPASEHCGQPCTGTGRRCDCAHRVDLYRKAPADEEPARCCGHDGGADCHPGAGRTA